MEPVEYQTEDEILEEQRHAEFGSGAFEDISEAFDQDAELLAANMGWD